jgi:glycerol uptake facilitator-like aquaporin
MPPTITWLTWYSVTRIDLGTHERMSARTVHESGLVSEVVATAELLPARHDLARRIAASPAISVQATLSTLWAACGLSSDQAPRQCLPPARDLGPSLARGSGLFTQRKSGDWKLR